jgi:hypothetical protein
MAKKVLTEQYYTFSPSTRTVVIPKSIQREYLILVTNVTQNKVIYNFSDPNLTATNYTVNNGVTTIALNYNTTTMSATDSLQFVYDDTIQEMAPAEAQVDSVGKMRVSEPESLIDTDFEYGTQPTKWENLATLNGRPSFFVDYQAPIAVADVRATNGSKTMALWATYTAGTGNGTSVLLSSTFTGSGTAFLTQVFPGYALYNASDVLIGTVSSVESDTSLTLQANAAVAITGAAFRIAPQVLPAVGNPIQVQDTLLPAANGGFLIEASAPDIGNSRWVLSYRGTSNFTGTTGSIFNTGSTLTYAGQFYSNSAISLSAVGVYSATAAGSAANDILLVVTSARNHGLSVGNLVYLTGTATVSLGTQPGGASYTVVAVYSPTKFGVIMAAGSSVPTISAINTLTAYVRNEATFSHRPYDGGVRFSTNNNSHNYQALRQTRRYFRYQSGKGIQFSTGAVLRPNFSIDGLTYNAGTGAITATTKEYHNLQPGDTFNVFGANETQYNGNFTIVDVNSRYEFTYIPLSTPSATAASGFPQIAITTWRGASCRLGMFDQQNGFYFEYDGVQLSAVKRSSVTQLSGLVATTNGSDQVVSVTTLGTGKQTKFTKQLVPGEWVVIRGQSYRVMEVINDQRIRINPEYRGSSLTAGVICKTVDSKYPQNTWNIDRADGYGPSGFTLDLNKMQMFYADYAWYGAGAIRFGFKNQTGNITYCHKIINSNVNTRSYMRSGNLPARYEVNTFVPYTALAADFTSGSTTLTVASTADFPSSGTLLIGDPGRDAADAALTGGAPGTGDYFEYVTYSSKTDTTFTISQRGGGLGMTGTTFAGYRSNYFVTSGGTVTTTSGSNTVTTSKAFTVNSPGNSLNMAPIGSYVTGTNIPENTFIAGYNSVTSTIELSQAATGSGAITDFIIYSMANTTGGANNSGGLHTYSATGPTIPVYLHSQAFAPTANHWGCSVIMDGRYDDDKSLVFTAGNSAYVTNYTSSANAAISLRMAPSVDSGATGLLGVKEIINRMQLKLNSLGVTSNGAFFVRVILNPKFVTNAPTFQAVGGSSLSQIAYHPSGTQISGGETVFAFYSDAGGGGNNYTTTSFDLTQVRDLGNSVLGGGTSNTLNLTSSASPNAGFYPDGPDIITIVASNVLTPVTIAPTTVTVGSPVTTLSDTTGFDVNWVVTANGGGGVPIGSIVKSVTPNAGGNFTVAFSKNATSAINGTLVISPPGNIAARLSWTEAQA